jgi:hypothetical protein
LDSRVGIGPEIEINKIVAPKNWAELKSIREKIINATKVAADYLYIHEEVEELTGPALKDEKIIYKGEEMDIYHFIETLITKSYKLNAAISVDKTGIDVRVVDLQILVQIILETNRKDELLKLADKKLNDFMVELNSKINYFEKLQKYLNRNIHLGRIEIENDFKKMVNEFEADHGLDIKKVLMGALGVPWYTKKYNVFKRIKP